MEPLDLDRRPYKVLVSGPYAAGKTSLITTASQGPTVSTESLTSGVESLTKSNTTVAMDFGTVSIDTPEPTRLMLFGTPGQERFRFMVDLLHHGVDALVFVVDVSSDLPEAATMFADLVRSVSVPVVIAVNRCEDVDTAHRVRRELGGGDTAPAVPCQLIDHASCDIVLNTVVGELRAAVATTATA